MSRVVRELGLEAAKDDDSSFSRSESVVLRACSDLGIKQERGTKPELVEYGSEECSYLAEQSVRFLLSGLRVAGRLLLSTGGRKYCGLEGDDLVVLQLQDGNIGAQIGRGIIAVKNERSFDGNVLVRRSWSGWDGFDRLRLGR